MDVKEAVRLKKFKVTRYAYQKLFYCKRCSRFTAIEEGLCPICGEDSTPVDKIIDRIIRKRCQMEMLILTALFLIGLILCRSLTDIYITLLAYFILFAVLLLIQRFFKKSEKVSIAYYFFKKCSNQIKQNLAQDVDIICKGMSSGEFKEVYENLRDIGVLLKSDKVKTNKLICLNRFIIRKDAELELDTLILSYYNPVLVKYIFEVSKLNMSLVKRSVIDYIIVNENKILEWKNGKEILASVAGAAIRIKSNIIIYKDFIARYTDVMRKDRLLRLFRSLQEWPSDELKDLYIRVNDIVQEKYIDEI